MKKLMVVAAVMIVAVTTHAASLNWTITNVKIPGSSPAAAASGYSAYLFISACNSANVSPTITTLKAVTALIGDDGWTTAVANLATATQTFPDTGTFASKATGLDGFTTGDSISGFAIVFDDEDLKDATQYYLVSLGETKSQSFTSSTGSRALTFGSQASNSVLEKNWYDIENVPEPTSAMLLLLGMAGLALKRKVA